MVYFIIPLAENRYISTMFSIFSFGNRILFHIQLIFPDFFHVWFRMVSSVIKKRYSLLSGFFGWLYWDVFLTPRSHLTVTICIDSLLWNTQRGLRHFITPSIITFTVISIK